MNTYYIGNENFIDSSLYKEFIRQNQGKGNLRIRAFSASGAIPIEGLKIVVYTIFDNHKIIFYEGFTDESGVIERIPLPAPKTNTDNLIIPNKTVYTIDATYIPDDIHLVYDVNMYDKICVVQNINIVPSLKVGGFTWR